MKKVKKTPKKPVKGATAGKKPVTKKVSSTNPKTATNGTQKVTSKKQPVKKANKPVTRTVYREDNIVIRQTKNGFEFRVK